MNDYETITRVIEHIIDHKLEQQPLAAIAESFGVSAGYLQKTFTRWVGISPKQFGRYLSLEYAKQSLQANHTTGQATFKTGLSSGGRLHDLFVDLVAMTPGEFKAGDFTITYSVAPSPFGQCLIATTDKGVCTILFSNSEADAFKDLQTRWPRANYVKDTTTQHDLVRQHLDGITPAGKIKVHVQGTNFQIKIWEALLTIPEGELASYGDIAEKAGDRKRARAAGRAIGSNPVGHLIPCHRVLKSSGEISGYRWGVPRKRAMLLHESLRTKKRD